VREDVLAPALGVAAVADRRGERAEARRQVELDRRVGERRDGGEVVVEPALVGQRLADPELRRAQVDVGLVGISRGRERARHRGSHPGGMAWSAVHVATSP
jgi:hypothetical protein